MATEAVDIGTDIPVEAFTFRITCPACDEPLLYENQVRRGQEPVCTEVLAVVRCVRHGRFEVVVRLMRSSVTPDKRPSGAEQRRRARERKVAMT